MATKRLFPTAGELEAPPPKPHDDLSKIQIITRDSPEGQEILAARVYRQMRLEAAGLDMTQVGMLQKLTKETN